MTEVEYLKRVETLAPHRFKTGDQRAREAGRLGGLRAGARKREIKAIQERIDALLDLWQSLKAGEVNGVRRLVEAAYDLAREKPLPSASEPRKKEKNR